MAREILVHLRGGSKLTVAKDHEHELRSALEKRAGSAVVRDSSGQQVLNTAHIVRIEIKS